jgi:DNA polymerase-3 subunit epsilon
MPYRLGVIDLETTGLSQKDGHKIIEVGFAMFKTECGTKFTKIGNTICKRINPQRPIDEKAFKVHGISLNDVKNCDVWTKFGPVVAKLMRGCDALAAHNAEFDIPFVVGELDALDEDYGEAEVICTMQSCREATPMGTVPNLGALCFAFGVEYDETKAHNAGFDVDATSDCLIQGIEKGIFVLESLEEYKAAQLENAA